MAQASDNAIKAWMKAATTEQQKRLAKLAKTSVGTLRHLVTGHRKASSAMAIRIEKASARIPDLPPLNRTDLSDTCKGCEYARMCTAKNKLW